MNDIYNRKDEEFTVIDEVPESFKFNDPLYKEGFQAGAASRDAEVTSLTNQRDYEFVRAENLLMERDAFEFSWAGCSQQLKDACADLEYVEKQRDQLREQVALLREALRDCAYDEGGFCINPDAAEALAATKPKITKPT